MVITHLKCNFILIMLFITHCCVTTFYKNGNLDFSCKNKVNFEFLKKIKLITFKKSTPYEPQFTKYHDISAFTL